MAAARQHLFVYGTLRRRHGHPMGRVLAAHARPVGEGDIAGRLYDVGHYPAAVPVDGETATVRGEVYALFHPRRVLTLLDRYEGCGPGDPEPQLYVRREVDVRLARGGTVRAWVYFYNRDTARLPLIRGGDYLARVSKARPVRGQRHLAHCLGSGQAVNRPHGISRFPPNDQ